MPSTVEVDVDADAERGTTLPTAKEGSNEGIPMDMVPEVVQQSKKSETSSSIKQVMGEGAEKISSPNIDAVPAELVADTDGTSTSPKENAGVQIALLQRKPNEATKDVATVGEGAEKTSCPNTDAVSAILVADTDGTSTRPKLSLIIKEEMMKKKGLPVKKAIDNTAPGKK